MNFEPLPEVFVVDPQLHDYTSFVRHVRRYGHHIFCARNGREGSQLRQTSSQGLWFIQLRLPDMSGGELHTMIKQRYPEAALCLISKTYQATDELQARQMGITLFDTKPTKLRWLQHWRHFCSCRGGPPSVPRHAMSSKTGRITFPCFLQQVEQQ